MSAKFTCYSAANCRTRVTLQIIVVFAVRTLPSLFSKPETEPISSHSTQGVIFFLNFESLDPGVKLLRVRGRVYE